MIASTNAIFTAFWGIRGVTLIYWLPQGASFNRAYFDEHILQVTASELHKGEEKKDCPSPLVQMDNARPHGSKRNLGRIEEAHLKCVTYLPFSWKIAQSDFFLFIWLKGKLSSRQVRGINGLFEIIDGILSTLTPGTIARAFGNSIERLT
jgi:hypothetical protein